MMMQAHTHTKNIMNKMNEEKCSWNLWTTNELYNLSTFLEQICDNAQVDNAAKVHVLKSVSVINQGHNKKLSTGIAPHTKLFFLYMYETWDVSNEMNNFFLHFLAPLDNWIFNSPKWFKRKRCFRSQTRAKGYDEEKYRKINDPGCDPF